MRAHQALCNKTKLLKLIYILDEFSVKPHGVPMFNPEYKVWQAGPVCDDVFIELSEEPVLLRDHIKTIPEGRNIRVEELKAFSDDEFTELKLMQDVVTRYQYTSAEELVKFCTATARRGIASPKSMKSIEPFEEGKLTNTDFTIDLQELPTGDPNGRNSSHNQEFIVVNRARSSRDARARHHRLTSRRSTSRTVAPPRSLKKFHLPMHLWTIRWLPLPTRTGPHTTLVP